jgi:predicted negative regulator of RcsB-dependent stress response
MASLRSEDEQIEALKRWWLKNGWSTVVSVAVVVALFMGWQSWQTRQTQYDVAASARYQQLLLMVQDLEQNPTEAQLATTAQWAETLKADFGDTAYAQFAALLLARYQVADGDLEGAQAQLRWVLDTDTDTATEHLAQLRLARVLYAQGDAEQAIAIAESIEGSAFVAGFYELQGDISSDSGDFAAARDFYQRALEQGSGAGGYGNANPMVQLKLDALPTADQATSAEQEG